MWVGNEAHTADRLLSQQHRVERLTAVPDICQCGPNRDWYASPRLETRLSDLRILIRGPVTTAPPRLLGFMNGRPMIMKRTLNPEDVRGALLRDPGYPVSRPRAPPWSKSTRASSVQGWTDVLLLPLRSHPRLPSAPQCRIPSLASHCRPHSFPSTRPPVTPDQPSSQRED